jgi:hypothetical protein
LRGPRSVLSPSQKLDYSFVHVHLFTVDGLLKYSTECAPNGYYFIPVYERGSFYLKVEGPEGWTFGARTARRRLRLRGGARARRGRVSERV